MRPSEFNPAPSVLLRPAFTVTGPMLETTIHRMLVSVINDAPAPKITVPSVVASIHELLRDGGINYFRDHALDNPHVMQEQQPIARAHARVLFPEFFPETTPEELKEFKKQIRDAAKAAAPDAGQEQQTAPDDAARSVGNYAPGEILPGQELAWDDPRQVRAIPDEQPVIEAAKAKRSGKGSKKSST